MNESIENRGTPAPRQFSERRQRKPDPWRRTLNYLTYLIYPLLLINVLVFMGLAGESQKTAAATRMEQAAADSESQTVQIPQKSAAAESTTPQRVSGWVHMNAFLPLMVVGLGIGGVGIVLDRKRARRRSDYSLMTPLFLIVLSALGMVIFFFV